MQRQYDNCENYKHQYRKYCDSYPMAFALSDYYCLFLHILYLLISIRQIQVCRTGVEAPCLPLMREVPQRGGGREIRCNSCFSLPQSRLARQLPAGSPVGGSDQRRYPDSGFHARRHEGKRESCFPPAQHVQIDFFLEQDRR